MLSLILYILTGVIKKREENSDIAHVPIPPNMDMVKSAFAKVPSEASNGEVEAVHFFYKNVIATLENTVTTDAMCGKSVMEALDVKTMIIRSQEEVHIVKAKKSTAKETRNLLEANVWVATMATGALLMDQRMGASDTESIVHNMIAGSDQKKKRPKQFKKGMATLRGAIYAEHYRYFMKIWEDNRTGGVGGEAAASRLAEWDIFTGMTKQEVLSDAQKRARRMPAYPDEDKENKKRKLEEGAVGGLSQFFFKKFDPNEPPPLTGTGDNGGSNSNGFPSSATESNCLVEAQNKEVQANPTTMI